MKFLLLPFLLLSSLAFSSTELPNFFEVGDGVYRGGRPSDDGLLQLKNLGVNTVINLQGGDVNWKDPAVAKFMAWWEPGETPENIAREKAIVNELQMQFVAAPLNSISHVSAEEDAEIEDVLRLLCSGQGRPIYIHCEHGQDRTGLVIALYRVRCQGVSPADAYKEWSARGHSGLSQYFTENLDKYFFEKTAR